MPDYRVTVRPQVTRINIVAGAPVVSGGGGGGSGDVVGPSSAADNAIARYDGTTGKLIQSSDATIDDSGGLFCDTLTTTNGVNVGGDLDVSGTIAGVDLVTLASDATDHFADVANPHSTDWTQLGPITTAELSGLVTGGVTNTPLASTTPAAVGTTGAVGTGTTAARADHVHAVSSATINTAGGQLRSTLTAKGDLYAATASGVVARRSVGTDGQVLTASSADPTGMAWTTFAGGGDVVGPASATDRAIAVYNTTTGKLIAGTGVIIDASDNITEVTSIVLDALTSAPSAPAAGLRVYGRRRAGRSWMDVVGPSGRDYPIQPALAFNGGGFWRPSITTTISALGLPLTNQGTVAHGTVASTSLLASTNRWRMALTSAAGAVSNRANTVCCWRGNGTGLGGFTLIFRVAFPTVGPNTAFFGGVLAAAGAIGSTQVPSALVSCLGVGFDIGQTTLRVMHNGASGTCTTIDLGASFPTNVVTALYTVIFHCDPNGSSVHYRVVREDTGTVSEGELTTDLPASATFLAPQLHMNNNAVAESLAYECLGLALDKDY